MKISLVCVFVILAITWGAGCSSGDGEQSDKASSSARDSGRPTVYVVNYPLQYFAERIAGEFASVHFPAPSEVDPAFWKPGAGAVGRYQQADLILLNGATYAKWIPQVSLPASKLINTSEGFRDRYIALEEATTHTHGPGGEHAHAGTAFTTWLDMTLAVEHARTVGAAFARTWPDGNAAFEANFNALETELLELDHDLRAIAEMNPQQLFVASHPVYQYLARRYGLNLESVHWEPDEIPSDIQWNELMSVLEHHPAAWMIWEGEPPPEVTERLESIGVQSIVFDPCANTPETGDFLDVMRANVENLKSAFAKP
ncbi:MAG: zinc ABC transporter substrate-binding protein [Candidatus Latescibacterota bacterium]|nr:MAG: zinc ABC transporter substrate-binding protein [Candidatus Latescibacterota bacterium]